MIKIKRNILFTLFSLSVVILMGGCQQEEIATLANGTLRLSIGYTAKKETTRSTPTQLGSPKADKFNLRIQRKGSDYAFYEGKFVSDLEVKVGAYDVTAYYGDNVAIGKDAPYYEGTASAVIENDAATSVIIPCFVANALVSVVYGRDEEERKRFDKYYKDYGVIVKVGDYSLVLTMNEVNSSIYFPAGSTPTLLFFGTLRENDEQVWCELSTESLPKPFEAADHAIVTLNLPDPESALNVDVTKVEVKTAMFDETIPLSWLPVSNATAQHHYDEQGLLTGTDITFSNSYPGMEWKAVVTNASGEEVRVVSGTGELKSMYDSSAEWPYLPSGEYKATFYLNDAGTYNRVGSRDFTIASPELKITVGGYSSYTKYLEGDVEGANACDRKTIYASSVALNVSESLLSNSKYDYSFAYNYAGASEQVEAGKNSYSVAKIENQTVSLTPYRLKADASFDGVAVSAYKDFHITGLPVSYAPPKESTGWKGSGERVHFENNEVRLGGDGGMAHYDEYIYTQDLAIPRHTAVTLDYNVMIHTATTGTTLTITLGKDELFSQLVGGGAFNSTDAPYNDSKTVSLAGNSTELKCHNSYGGGLTCSYIYSLILNYGNK